MRKFLSGGSQDEPLPVHLRSASGAGDSAGVVGATVAAPARVSRAGQGDQELLGLSHLKKLFAEFQKSSGRSLDSEEAREERLYMMLPLFCKIFANVNPKVITNKFPNVKVFTQVTSRLLVTEVRRRASNQSTEEAAAAIAGFMEVDTGTSPEDSGSNGWLLLSTLNLLLGEGDVIAEVMARVIYDLCKRALTSWVYFPFIVLTLATKEPGGALVVLKLNISFFHLVPFDPFRWCRKIYLIT